MARQDWRIGGCAGTNDDEEVSVVGFVSWSKTARDLFADAVELADALAYVLEKSPMAFPNKLALLEGMRRQTPPTHTTAGTLEPMAEIGRLTREVNSLSDIVGALRADVYGLLRKSEAE